MVASQASLLALFAVLLVGPIGPRQDVPPVRLVDGDTRVELNLDGVRLADFLAAAQPILGLPVDFEPADCANWSIHQVGAQRVDRAEFRDTFDALLRRYDLWTNDDTSGPSPVIVVRRLTPGRLGSTAQAFKPLPITLAELAAGPAHRAPIYSVVFPLAHVPARDLGIVLMPMIDLTFESIRAIDEPNQLVVNGSREHLLAIRDTLARIDIPGAAEVAAADRIAALEQQVADLTARVAALEKSAPR